MRESLRAFFRCVHFRRFLMPSSPFGDPDVPASATVAIARVANRPAPEPEPEPAVQVNSMLNEGRPTYEARTLFAHQYNWTLEETTPFPSSPAVLGSS
jgi:hypothetical protein